MGSQLTTTDLDRRYELERQVDEVVFADFGDLTLFYIPFEVVYDSDVTAGCTFPGVTPTPTPSWNTLRRPCTSREHDYRFLTRRARQLCRALIFCPLPLRVVYQSEPSQISTFKGLFRPPLIWVMLF